VLSDHFGFQSFAPFTLKRFQVFLPFAKRLREKMARLAF